MTKPPASPPAAKSARIALICTGVVFGMLGLSFAAVPLYRAFWQVIAALVPKIGFPALPSAEALQAMRETPAPGWPEIRAAAIASNDEHDVSLVFSASQEEMVWHDPLYRVVAARRVRLI